MCRKNNPVEKEMISVCIRDGDIPFGLHYPGITRHIYADT
ncbi:DUF6765 family protein [Desulfospira joergensenii]